MTIQGVELKELTRHTDERGFFCEIIRETDPFFKAGFGQWSYSKMVSGVIKAWHIHGFQWDWWFVPFGIVKAVLYDLREESPTYKTLSEYLLGDDQKSVVLSIPPGVAHGLKVVQGPAYLFYVTSEVYNPDDEGRLLFDDPVIGYDWLKGAEIK